MDLSDIAQVQQYYVDAAKRSRDAGFDIAGGANGLVLAALRVSPAGPSTLYRIDLQTGAAVPVNGAASPALSVIGSGTPGLIDIAVAIK